MTAEVNGRLVIDASDQGGCIDLAVGLLRRDGETQSRASLNNEVIGEYAELMLEGIQFLPVRAYFDGSYYWLSDGFHRVAAVELLRRETIRVEVIPGSLTDAKWDSYKANSLHGLRRTPEDVRLTLSRAIHHERALHLSNRELARQLYISERTVRRFRDSSPATSATPERLAIRNGKEYKIRTENIGKARQQRSHRTGRPATLERRLLSDLLFMDREASAEARRILNIFKSWTLRTGDAASILRALETVVRELKGMPPLTRQNLVSNRPATK